MEQKVRIEPTADGSHTLFVPSLDEHYHSVNGAMQESAHIYIKAGLQHSTKDEINVLEIGFGTGLNAYLTIQETQTSTKKIDYTTLELYPLPMSVVQQLNYAENDVNQEQELFSLLHASHWELRTQITPSFALTKLEVDFTQIESEWFDSKLFDVIYFDAFAPEKQSEMWSQSLFDTLYEITNVGGILTTYCAKGVVRRMLQQSGYKVERLPGPPGKREILRATKS